MPVSLMTALVARNLRVGFDIYGPGPLLGLKSPEVAQDT